MRLLRYLVSVILVKFQRVFSSFVIWVSLRRVFSHFSVSGQLAGGI